MRRPADGAPARWCAFEDNFIGAAMLTPLPRRDMNSLAGSRSALKLCPGKRPRRPTVVASEMGHEVA
jgi:hypothetical protein